jgi:multidrug efflux pump subunit AcrA (membrane-fusion protein)
MEQELENKNGENVSDDIGDENQRKRKRRQRLSMVAVIIVIALIAAGSITAYLRTRKSDGDMSEQGFGRREDGFGGGSIITATGTTSVGIDAVTFDIDFLEDTSLYVEEVYLENGDEVEAGTKYLKLTDSSVESARKELKSALLSAQLEYRSGVISNKESQISAKYDYDMALLEASQAQAVYDETIASLQAQLDKAKEAYDDANEDYNELYNAIENNTFYADYEVAEKKKAYEDAMELYDNRMEYWGLTEDDLTQSSQDTMGGGGNNSNSSSSSNSNNNNNAAPTLSGSAGSTVGLMLSGDVSTQSNEDSSGDGSSGEDSSGDGSDDGNPDDSDSDSDNKDDDDSTNTDNANKGDNKNKPPAGGQQPDGAGGAKGADSTADESKWITKTASLLKAEYEEAEEEYEQALSDYEDAKDSAELDIQQLYLALETAREDYEDASLNFQKQSQSAKTLYETTLVKGDTAKLDYETQLTSLEEQLSKLEDAKDDAQDNLATFEETIGDGYLYTEEAGTILMVMTKEDNALTGGEMLFAYSNPEKISVSVSVSQEYISELYVGEAATVIIDEYGQYTGTVQTINPVSSSDTRTSVYYTVTVLLDTDDISDLSANLTATVMFGDVEMPQGNDGMPDDGTPNEGMPNDGTPNDGMPNDGTPNDSAPSGGKTDNGEMPNADAPNENKDSQGDGKKPDMKDSPQGGSNE